MPGYWAFFGGGVKQDESVVNAVQREVLEELNYRLRSPKLLKMQDFRVDKFAGRMYVFIEYCNGDKSELKLLEGQGWSWFSASEIDKLKMVAHDRCLIKLISRYVKKTNGKQKIREKTEAHS